MGGGHSPYSRDPGDTLTQQTSTSTRSTEMGGYKLTQADEERLGLALHEAAHAVCGVLAGATVERALVTDGECMFTQDSFSTDRRRYHRALVNAAGPVASAIVAHGDGVTLRQLERHLFDGDREELRL
mgnify:CR=1 FL=1